VNSFTINEYDFFFFYSLVKEYIYFFALVNFDIDNLTFLDIFSFSYKGLYCESNVITSLNIDALKYLLVILINCLTIIITINLKRSDSFK